MRATELARRLPGPCSPTDLTDLARRGLVLAVRRGRQWDFPLAAVGQARRRLEAHEPGTRWPRRGRPA